MKNFKIILYLLIISIFYIILFLKLDLGKCLVILVNLNLPLFITAAFVIQAFYFLIIGYRWYTLMKTQEIHYSYRDSLIMYLKGFSTGVVTPGKLGEFIKFFNLINDGHPISQSLSITIVDRIIDLIFLGFVAYISLFKFLNNSVKDICMYGSILVLIFVFIFFIISKPQSVHKLLNFILLKLLTDKIKETYFANLNDSYLDFKKPTNYQLFLILCLSFITMAISFLTVYLLARSLDINISFLEAVSCYSISTLTTLIPVSLYGIGVRDISLIALFSHYGLSSESAIAFSILLLIAYIISGIICSIAWIYKPSINN